MTSGGGGSNTAQTARMLEALAPGPSARALSMLAEDVRTEARKRALTGHDRALLAAD